MTATPHNGKEEDFQLFLSLLDSDRFYGKFRDGVHKVDTSDLMRRMVKEELVKFDGTPLFPERRAYTVNYKLSERSRRALRGRHDYVKTEMGKADQLDGQRKGLRRLRLTPSSAASPPAPRPSTSRSSAAASASNAGCARKAGPGSNSLAETSRRACPTTTTT
jgi:hypothetical protein